MLLMSDIAATQSLDQCFSDQVIYRYPVGALSAFRRPKPLRYFFTLVCLNVGRMADKAPGPRFDILSFNSLCDGLHFIYFKRLNLLLDKF